jgi:hypothetical protein
MNKLLAVITAVVKTVVNVLTGSSSATFKLPHPPQTHKKEFSVEVVRPDDLLVLTLDFYNTHVNTAGAGPAQLQQTGPGDGFIVAHFQPQSFAEQAFFEAETAAQSEELSGPPVASRISGPSQLIFRVDPSLLPFAFTLEKILAVLAQSETVVQRWIQPPLDTPPVGAMAKFGGTNSHFTAIEAPYRLVLSPSLDSRWEHALKPVLDAAKKRTELWHTRISSNSTASALWSPDYAGKTLPSDPAKPFPFRMSLTSRNRHQIVGSTADQFGQGIKPIDVGQLMLSSQGAWLDVHGQWDSQLTKLDLVEWRQIMTSGRDQYARVVEAGYLFPFGHRAVLVRITERKLKPGGFGNLETQPVAYLLQREFIIVREPTKNYQHREVPFRSATIKTLVTPNLDPSPFGQIFNHGRAAFWPTVGTKDFLFHIVATDWEGEREIDFHIPLAFMLESFTADHPEIKRIIKHYNGRDMPEVPPGQPPLPVLFPGVAETDIRRARPMGGQKIAFAPFAVHGDTTLETSTMIFGACGSDASPPLPPFLPAMAKAQVDVPEVRQISGSTAPSTIQFREDYLKTHGTSVIGNLGHVFANVLAPTPVKFSSDQTGGMVAPDFSITGLSRAAGPVGGGVDKNGDDKFSTGTFDPVATFPNVKLLGGIELSGIICDIKNLIPSGPSIPKLKTKRITEGGKEFFETSYRWDVDQSGLIDQSKPPDPPPPPPPGPAIPFQKGMFTPDTGARFLIETIVKTPLDGTAPISTVSGELNNFSVTMLPEAELVRLHFTSVKFSAGLNGKTDFAVIFKKFEFLGILTFVNKLMDVIPMDGFNDPPFLDLILPPESPGVRVGFTQGIPTVGIGIFSLENIAFSAGFFLPFLDGPANLRLAFCERHQPFTLTVSLLGGGGFFAIDIGFKGVRSIEAALEFGASVALNLGVASGSATVMGGVYFKAGENNAFELSAYVRAAGSLEVLGIITVSVELYVALSYASKTAAEHAGKLWGQASISVKIKIAFFSKSVSISIEREFAGSDPKFFETISPAVWSEYCTAFADCPV